MRVAVVGDALLDVVVSPSRPMRRGGDVPATVRVEPGGQGANLAVRLVRRGVTVRLACALGDDVAGRVLREALEAEGVELLPVTAPSTGAVAVLVDDDGERTMLSQRVPLGDALDLRALAVDAGWLLISGYLLLEPNAAEVARAMATLPLRRVVAGCSLDSQEAEAWASVLTTLTPDLVMLNHVEALAVGDGLRALPEAVVITTDPAGATASSAGSVTRVERPVRSDFPRDTTGAGDAFAAALVAELIDDPWPPNDVALTHALQAATELAATVTRVAGAQGRVHGERDATLPA